MVYLPGQRAYYGFSGTPGAEDPNATPVDPNQMPDQAVPTRSWGRSVLDNAIGAVSFIPEAARAVTTGARMIENDPHGWAAEADRIAGRVNDWVQSGISERGHVVGEKSFLPGPDEQSAWGDLGAKTGEVASQALPFMLGGVEVKGLQLVGKLMEKFGIPLMGAQQFGNYAGKLRSYFDNTKPEDFEKDPVLAPLWQKAVKDAGGDELAARDALYNQAFDTGSAVANAVAGAAGGAALGRQAGKLIGRVGEKLGYDVPVIQNRLARGAIGVGEGTVTGAGMGAAGAYGQETTNVNLGRQPGVNVENVLRGAGAGAIPMAIMTGVSHAVGPIPPDLNLALTREFGPKGRPMTPPTGGSVDMTEGDLGGGPGGGRPPPPPPEGGGPGPGGGPPEIGRAPWRERFMADEGPDGREPATVPTDLTPPDFRGRFRPGEAPPSAPYEHGIQPHGDELADYAATLGQMPDMGFRRQVDLGSNEAEPTGPMTFTMGRPGLEREPYPMGDTEGERFGAGYDPFGTRRGGGKLEYGEQPDRPPPYGPHEPPEGPYYSPSRPAPYEFPPIDRPRPSNEPAFPPEGPQTSEGRRAPSAKASIQPEYITKTGEIKRGKIVADRIARRRKAEYERRAEAKVGKQQADVAQEYEQLAAGQRAYHSDEGGGEGLITVREPRQVVVGRKTAASEAARTEEVSDAVEAREPVVFPAPRRQRTKGEKQKARGEQQAEAKEKGRTEAASRREGIAADVQKEHWESLGKDEQDKLIRQAAGGQTVEDRRAGKSKRDTRVEAGRKLYEIAQKITQQWRERHAADVRQHGYSDTYPDPKTTKARSGKGNYYSAVGKWTFFHDKVGPLLKRIDSMTHGTAPLEAEVARYTRGLAKEIDLPPGASREIRLMKGQEEAAAKRHQQFFEDTGAMAAGIPESAGNNHIFRAMDPKLSEQDQQMVAHRDELIQDIKQALAGGAFTTRSREGVLTTHLDLPPGGRELLHGLLERLQAKHPTELVPQQHEIIGNERELIARAEAAGKAWDERQEKLGASLQSDVHPDFIMRLHQLGIIDIKQAHQLLAPDEVLLTYPTSMRRQQLHRQTRTESRPRTMAEVQRAVYDHMNGQLKKILEDFGKRFPNQRRTMLKYANEVMDYDLRGDAIRHVMTLLSRPETFERLSEQQQEQYLRWLMQRTMMQNMFDQLRSSDAVKTRQGKVYGAAEADRDPGLRPIENIPVSPEYARREREEQERIAAAEAAEEKAKAEGRGIEWDAQRGVIRKEPPPAPPEKPKIAGKRTLVYDKETGEWVNPVAENIADWLVAKKGAAKPDLENLHDYVEAHSVKQRLSGLMDPRDKIDDHLRDVILKSGAGDVPIVGLHDEVYTAVMKRLGADPDSHGYYDWRTDQIFIRKQHNQNKGLVRHELMHAMTMGAIERNPQYKAQLERLRQSFLKERGQWERLTPDPDGLAKRLGDVHEFISEVWANPELRGLMAGTVLRAGDAATFRARPNSSIYAKAINLIRDAVKAMFRKASKDNYLNEALIQSWPLLDQAARIGRHAYKGDELTGAAGRIDDIAKWAKEAGHDTVDKWQYRIRHAGTIAKSKTKQLMQTKDIVDLLPADAREMGLKVLDQLGYRDATRSGFNKQHGSEQMLVDLHNFLQGKTEAQRVRFFKLLKAESDMQAYADHPLDEKDADGKRIGMNKHVNDNPVWDQTRMRHGEVASELESLKSDMPGYDRRGTRIHSAEEMRQKLYDWDSKTSDLVSEAKIRDALSEEPLVKGDKTATDAMTKLIMDKAADLTGPEKSWIESQRRPDDPIGTMAFDQMVRGYRNSDEWATRAGPFTPYKRHGDYAVIGRYNMVDPTKFGGRDLGDGMVEFPSKEAGDRYLAAHMDEGPGTKLRSYHRRVVDAEGNELMRSVEQHQLEGSLGNNDFIETTKTGEKRVPASAVAKYPGAQVRHVYHYNDRFYAQFYKEHEAARAIEKLRKGDSTLKLRGEPEMVRGDDRNFGSRWASQHMKQYIERVTSSPEFKMLSKSEQNAFYRRMNTEAAKAIMQAGGAKGGAAREYVEGQSPDLLENYREQTMQAAHVYAMAKHGPDLRAAADALRQHLGDMNRDNPPTNRLRNEMSDELFHRMYREPDQYAHTWWGKQTNRLLKASYIQKLAGPSFLAINAMEPWLIHLPEFAAKYGWAAALNEMRKAYRDVNSGKWLVSHGFEDMKNAALRRNVGWADYEEKLDTNLKNAAAKHGNANIDAELEMFREMARKGFFEPDSINQISLLPQPETNLADHALNYMDRVFRGMNNAVEVQNRAVLALAGHRLEAKYGKGKSGETAAETALRHQRAAEEAVYKGAGQYADWNAPPLFNDPRWRMALQFKKYPQRIIGNYVRAIAGSLEKGNWEKRRQLAYMFGMQGMAAGLFGMYFEPFAMATNALSPVTGTTWADIQASTYKMLAREFGPGAAEIMAHGVGRMFGVEFANRLSHSDLAFFGDPKGSKWSDVQASIGAQVMGAPGSTLQGWYDGIRNISRAIQENVAGSPDTAWQYWREGIRDIMPIRMGTDLWDAFLPARQTPSGQALRPEYDAGSMAVRALGFRPSAEARGTEMKSVEGRATAQLAADKKTLLDRWAQATRDNRNDIANQIREFNSSHPAFERITEVDKAGAVSRRRTAEKRPATQYGANVSKRNMPLHQELSAIYNIGG